MVVAVAVCECERERGKHPSYGRHFWVPASCCPSDCGDQNAAGNLEPMAAAQSPKEGGKCLSSLPWMIMLASRVSSRGFLVLHGSVGEKASKNTHTQRERMPPMWEWFLVLSQAWVSNWQDSSNLENELWDLSLHYCYGVKHSFFLWDDRIIYQWTHSWTGACALVLQPHAQYDIH